MLLVDGRSLTLIISDLHAVFCHIYRLASTRLPVVDHDPHQLSRAMRRPVFQHACIVVCNAGAVIRTLSTPRDTTLR